VSRRLGCVGATILQHSNIQMRPVAGIVLDCINVMSTWVASVSLTTIKKQHAAQLSRSGVIRCLLKTAQQLVIDLSPASSSSSSRQAAGGNTLAFVDQVLAVFLTLNATWPDDRLLSQLKPVTELMLATLCYASAWLEPQWSLCSAAKTALAMCSTVIFQAAQSMPEGADVPTPLNDLVGDSSFRKLALVYAVSGNLWVWLMNCTYVFYSASQGFLDTVQRNGIKTQAFNGVGSDACCKHSSNAGSRPQTDWMPVVSCMSSASACRRGWYHSLQ
jgi:hypothetical protein